MFQTYYNDKSNVLYKIFKGIYNSKEKDILINYKLFEQLILPINRKKYNNYILLKHGNDIYYKRNKDVHVISNEYEISRLKVNNTFLKIKTNRNINSFIKDIISSNEKVFVIDFKNKDYFWINEINHETLV